MAEEALKKKLLQLLVEKFADAKIEDLQVTAGRVGGVLIWSGFKEMAQVDRQQELWKILRSNLDREEQLKISLIITLTPTELAAIDS